MFFQKPFNWLLTGLAAIASFQVSAQKKQDEFLIRIYALPSAEFVNDEQFKLMKEGNVDIIFNIGGSLSNDKAGNLKMLDMAQKHGLKVYPDDARVNETDDARKAMVNDYKNHSALAGYNVTDELDSARLQSAVETMLKVKKLDPAKDAYITPLPGWAVNNYENDFLKRYIAYAGKENLNGLAYDKYPCKRKQKPEKTYINYLDIIRRTGPKYGIKTSSCLQSFDMYFSGVEELRKPNPDEMRMNVDAQEVYHTGDSLRIGTKLPPVNFPTQIADEQTEAIISRFTDKSSGQMYLMIVDRSFKKPSQITVKFDDSIKKLKEIS